MSTDAPILIPVPLAWLVTHWRPGSHEWTWLDEYNDLLGDPRTLAIERRVIAEGIGFMDRVAPILLGSDGRVWDGHHRIVLAMKHGIGWVKVEGPITPTPAPAPSVVPEAAAADQALAALVEVAKIGLPLEERRMVDEHAAQIRAALTAPPAAPESAVEAFKAAWHKADDEGREGERVRDGLAAALPFLTAAPSVTHEAVEAAVETGLGEWKRKFPARWCHEAVADALLAHFTITPKEDR